METSKERLLAAGGAQVLAQALTAWALIAHFLTSSDVSVWVVASLGVSFLVPFRHDGSLRDRAASNFGAGLLVAGILWWDVLAGGLSGLLGGSFGFGIETVFMLTATVLFSVAGALFWLMRDESAGGGGWA
ncbi:MAG: hypothetical protein O2958_04555 [Gemmatimonadetes bacterium]|nr:hypothetical protein [Gemmatimonadota bacterium]MDA1102578.1 hypothetical protein [Gemmatimonadota bacterium]